jgi:hypothetical protein
MIKTTRICKPRKSEFAQTMVEFALVFPIILLITYGLIEFGRMIFIYTEISGAAREGARYGAASGIDLAYTPQAPNYANCQGIIDAVKRVTVLIPPNDIIVTIKYYRGPDQDHTSMLLLKNGCPPGNTKILSGDRIMVSVNYFFQPIIGGFLGIQGFNIPATNYRTLLMKVNMDQ